MNLSFTRISECADCGVQTAHDAAHCATCQGKQLRIRYKCSGCGSNSTKQNCKRCSTSVASAKEHQRARPSSKAHSKSWINSFAYLLGGLARKLGR